MTRIHLAVMLLLAAVGVLLFTAPAHSTTARCRDARGRFVKCPPPPAPAPTPSPSPVLAYPVVSPNGLKGEFDVADNFDLASTLKPTVETVPVSGDPVGAFRFTCLAGQLAKDDPIVYPGQPGKSHLHQFFGNTGTNASSTYQSLRTTGASTCTINGLSGSPQRTAYWMPAMIVTIDGIAYVLKPDFILTYYKQLPNGSPECKGAPDATHVGYCVAIANGTRFIVGYNMATGEGGPTADPNGPFSTDYWGEGFECESPDQQTTRSGFKHTFQEVIDTGKCQVGDFLRVAIAFPSCWNGKDLDTADHRSHLAYPNGPIIDNFLPACPVTHPYSIPQIAEQVFFRVDANFLAGKWELACDSMTGGKPKGACLHFDYWEAWSAIVKNDWQTGCIDKHLSCNVGEMGNGQSISGMQQTHPEHVLVPLSSIP
jgi:hypothetical protein